MKLTIEPTEHFFEQDGAVLRVWTGADEHGAPVSALVSGVRAEHDDACWGSELISIPPPSTEDACRWAQKILDEAGAADSKITPAEGETPDDIWYLCMRTGELEGTVYQGDRASCVALAENMVGQPVVTETTNGLRHLASIERAWVTQTPVAGQFKIGTAITPEMEGTATDLECTQTMMMLFAETMELLQSREALGRRRAEVEALGHRLHGMGGMDAMRLIEDTVRRMYPHGQGGPCGWHPRELSVCWNGIGAWMD